MLRKLQNKTSVDKKFAKTLKIGIVRTDYHDQLNSNLEKHCAKTLISNGVLPQNVQTFSVPGSWEIPLMTKRLAMSKKFDALIAFGVIIKGETHHFDMIANEVGHALMQLSLQYNLPIALEVLAVYKKKQAEVRAGDNEHNKGIEGATAVLKTLQVLHEKV